MARTFTAGERTNVGAAHFNAFAKLEITDPDGTWRDVSTGLLGVDWLDAVMLSDNIDMDAATLSGSLLRETGLKSLSPFRSDSLVNRNAAAAYAPMLDLWRKWRVSTAIMAAGGVPVGSDWKELNAGRMDVIDVADEEIRIQGRSEDAVWLDCWITVERQYGSVGGVAIETVLQQMLDDNLGTGRANVGSSGYTISTPVSPGYNMNTWTQPVGKLGEALAAVAKLPGMVLRFRYDAANVQRPTLVKPNRVATVEDWSLGPTEYTSISECKISLAGIRNVAKVAYMDSSAGKQIVYSPKNTGTITCAAGAATFSTSQAGVIANGSVIVVHGLSGFFVVSAFNGTTGCTLSGAPTFSASNWGTNASLTQYLTRRDIEIDLSAQTQVVTGANAQGFADAVVSDTQFPNMEQTIDTTGFWFVQLFDYGKFLANGVHYNADQFGGITSIDHALAKGTVLTTLGARGKPAGRYAAWRRLSDATTIGSTDTTPQPVQPPSAYITLGASVLASDTLSFSGSVGKGGASPLSWQWRSTVSGATPGAWSAWVVATGGNALPFSQAISRHARWQTSVEFQTRDANGLLSPIAGYPVDSRIDFLDDTTGAPKRGHTWDDGAYTLSATENNGTTKSSSAHNPQGSLPPTSMPNLPFNYATGGAGSSAMWIALSWSAFTTYRADGTSISIPASSSLPTPPTPTLSQVALGSLGARTLFVRIGYVKNGMIYRAGAEASLAVTAGDVLKITSPPSVPGFDGWVPLVGSATNAEKQQSTQVNFGTDWTEPSTGFDTTGTAYNNANWPNAVIAAVLNISTAYFFYPYWDIALGMVVFTDSGLTSKTATAAIAQNGDGKIGLSPGAMSVTTPGAGGSNSGAGGGGNGGKLL